MRDKSKFIVILGGSGGIGNSIINSLMDEDVVIIATGSNTVSIKKIASDHKSPNIIPYVLDLENPETLNDFVNFIKNKTNKVDWFINSAGFISKKELDDVGNKKIIDKTFAINVQSLIYIESKLIPMFKKTGGVINISSSAGIWGNESYPIYSSAKSAVINFGVSLAKKYKGVFSSIVICPGPTNTNMRKLIADDAEQQQNPDVIGKLIRRIVLGLTDYKTGDVILVRGEQEILHSRTDSDI